MAEIRDLGRIFLRPYVTDGVPSSGHNKPDKDEGIAAFDKIDEEVATLYAAVAAAQEGYNFITQIVRVRTTGNVNLSALTAGSTHNGVTLAAGDNVFRGLQSSATGNGIFTVQPTGDAVRATFADSPAELARIGFVIQEGTVGAGERWVLNLAEADITVGTTALNFSLYGIEVGYAAEVAEARGDEDSLGDRLDAIEDSIAVVGPDVENNYKRIIFDSDDNAALVEAYDNSTWQAQDGELVQVASGSGTFLAPDIEDRWRQPTFDTDGKMVAAWRDGRLYEASGGFMQPVIDPPATRTWDGNTGTQVPTDTIQMVVGLGQSLMQGFNELAGDTTVTTAAEHPGYALMFDVGARPDGRDVSSFVDLHEQVYLGSKETIFSGMADAIMRGCDAATGQKPKMLFTCAGRGGTTYAGSSDPLDGIKRGTVQYNEILRLVRRATEIAAETNQRIAVTALVLAHGETDTAIGTTTWQYRRAMSQLRMDLQADVRRITGQTEPLRGYAYQPCRGDDAIGVPSQVAQAMLDAPEHDPGWICVGPNYFAEDATGGGTPGDVGVDVAHPSAAGYRRIGQMFGQAMFRDLLGPWFTPMRVIDCWWVSSAQFALKYPYPVMIESTDDLITVSTLGPGKGIDFTDGSVSPPDVDSIAVSGSDNTVVLVTLDAAPTGLRPQAFIASRETANACGPVHGARAGIRSTAAYDTDPVDSTDLYHWACMQHVDL